jgi:ArsR family transcriptional regulator
MHEVRAGIFKALAHPKRIVLINELRDGAKSVQELSAGLDIPQANIAQHMAILSDWGLVCIRPDGNKVYCCLTTPEIVQHLEKMAHVLEEAHSAKGDNGWWSTI